MYTQRGKEVLLITFNQYFLLLCQDILQLFYPAMILIRSLEFDLALKSACGCIEIVCDSGVFVEYWDKRGIEENSFSHDTTGSLWFFVRRVIIFDMCLIQINFLMILDHLQNIEIGFLKWNL